MSWPQDRAELAVVQIELAAMRPVAWIPRGEMRLGGCFVCFGRGGSGPGTMGDHGWAAAVVTDAERRVVAGQVVAGLAGAPYERGLLALREGALIEASVRSLEMRPDVLVVNATGRDHPRRAGLALHLGWVLDLPTVGVTNRTLSARGPAPAPGRGSRTPLGIGSEQVGWWLRTRDRAHPVAVSPGWRMGLDESADVVLAATGAARTPEVIRQARRLARTARASDPR